MPKMFALVTDQETAAAETALCGDCFQQPENQGYAREQASQSDDVDPNSDFQDCSQNDALECCICGKGIGE
jgi:hypothetical protein